MKKFYSYMLIIIVLMIIIMIGQKSHKASSSIRVDKRDFFVNDTSAITQITLSNKNLENITLHRNNNGWVVNDSLEANQNLINLILKTIKEMRIKTPIARTALPNVIQRMAIQNTEVNVFQKNKKIKTIYVGGETPDQLGTFMMLHGAKEPYVMHIPGFTGYLSSRFSCKEDVWKSKKIFHNHTRYAQYKFDTIYQDVQESNLLELNHIYAEAFLKDNDYFDVSEIKKRPPFYTLETIDERGKKHTLYCIRKKPVSKEKYREHTYDRERFYGLINNTLILIQYKQFEKFTNEESITHKFMPWKKLNSF